MGEHKRRISVVSDPWAQNQRNLEVFNWSARPTQYLPCAAPANSMFDGEEVLQTSIAETKRCIALQRENVTAVIFPGSYRNPVPRTKRGSKLTLSLVLP